MLHELPELPAPTAALWASIEAGAWDKVHARLHPEVVWRDGQVGLAGRAGVLAHLRSHPTPRPPTTAEVRDGQVRRWVR
jgi:hypothetical protein